MQNNIGIQVVRTVKTTEKMKKATKTMAMIQTVKPHIFVGFVGARVYKRVKEYRLNETNRTTAL